MFSKINWRYALGEILIVIVGISIAFALNNWGINREARKQKVRYLENLKKDLQMDIMNLDSNIIQLNDRCENISLIRKYTYHPNEQMDTILQKMYSLSFPIEFRPRNITYQTLINSGDFKLIDKFELKAAIQEHYIEYDHILEEYNRQNILVEKYVGNYFMTELDYTKIYAQKDYSFMQTSFFKNMISSLFSTFKIKIKASERGKQYCNTLIEKIDKELN